MLSITRNGSQLFSQLVLQGVPPSGVAEIYPETENSFFATVLNVDLRFESDPDGRVTGLVIGQNTRATRIVEGG